MRNRIAKIALMTGSAVLAVCLFLIAYLSGGTAVLAFLLFAVFLIGGGVVPAREMFAPIGFAALVVFALSSWALTMLGISAWWMWKSKPEPEPEPKQDQKPSP